MKLEEDKKALLISAQEKDVTLQKKLKTVGNYVHHSVPTSDNEDNNTVIRTWPPERTQAKNLDCLSHHEVLTRINGYDPIRGVKVAGHRGYCLIDDGLLLNMALVNYGLHFLRKKEYTLCQPPFFMLRDAMAKTAQLEQFDEELYKVTEGKDAATDKYLIATSEQPISAMHAEEWLQPNELPIRYELDTARGDDMLTNYRYGGYSTNFRKEAGSHGKDAWGTFRVHQFEKVTRTSRFSKF